MDDSLMYFYFPVLYGRTIHKHASVKEGSLEEGKVVELRFKPGPEKPRGHPHWEQRHLHPVKFKSNKLQDYTKVIKAKRPTRRNNHLLIRVHALLFFLRVM